MDLDVQTLLDTAPQALVVLDHEGRVLSCNRAAERLLGVGREQLRDRPVVEVAVPERLHAWTQRHLSDVLGEDPRHVRGRFSGFIGLHGDGTEFPAEVLVEPVADDPPCFAAWMRDVSGEGQPRTLLADAERVGSVGHFTFDARTGLTTWSPAIYEILGVTPEEQPPSAEAFVECVHPADRELVGPQARASRDSGFEVRILRPDGEVRTVHAVRRVTLGEDGELLRIEGVMRDVTRERVAEALWAAHRGVHDVLVAWEGFAEGIGALLARLGVAMGWAAGGLWVPEDDGRALVCRGFWSRPGDDLEDFERLSRRLRLTPGTGLVARAFADRRLVASPDVTAMAGYRRKEAAERAGLRSAMALPAIHDDEVLAVLELYAPEHREVDETARTSLRIIGEQLGAFLSRRRGELRPGALTPREIDVLQLAARGNGVSEIAEALVLSTGTVRTHFKNIYDRLGVRDRAAAVAEAMRLGLVS